VKVEKEVEEEAVLAIISTTLLVLEDDDLSLQAPPLPVKSSHESPVDKLETYTNHSMLYSSDLAEGRKRIRAVKAGVSSSEETQRKLMPQMPFFFTQNILLLIIVLLLVKE
jgi:hypothetical protein